MSTPRPYFSECSICGNGLLRFWICVRTRDTALLCDECEAIWEDIPALAEDNDLKPSHLYPDWPGDNRYKWQEMTCDELKNAGFERYIQDGSV